MGSITIPDTVTEIGAGAFQFCDSLKEIRIPNSVNTIDIAAFERCKNLRKVTIPSSVQTIGSGAFGDTPWLEEKQKENPLVIINNMLIDGTKAIGTLTIPKKVIKICGGAFFGIQVL